MNSLVLFQRSHHRIISGLLVTRSSLLAVNLLCVFTAAMSSGVRHSDIYVPPDINQLTPDAKQWYLKGVANAESNLTAFEAIANALKAGDPIKEPFKAQLTSLLGPVSEANQNTIALVPKLEGLVNNLYSWSQNPGWIQKAEIKAAIWYVNGKRDNKSYYLLNGAALWSKLRVDKYLKPISGTAGADEVTKELNTFEDQILTARDSLDDSAQQYVKGIAQLVKLVCDIGKNLKEIQKVTGEMKSEMDKGKDGILKSSQEAVDSIQAKIDQLN